MTLSLVANYAGVGIRELRRDEWCAIIQRATDGLNPFLDSCSVPMLPSLANTFLCALMDGVRTSSGHPIVAGVLMGAPATAETRRAYERRCASGAAIIAKVRAHVRTRRLSCALVHSSGFS